jgi:hypothetical protein
MFAHVCRIDTFLEEEVVRGRKRQGFLLSSKYVHYCIYSKSRFPKVSFARLCKMAILKKKR